MSVTIYNHEKMFTYIKGFATGVGIKEPIPCRADTYRAFTAGHVSLQMITTITMEES